MNGSIDALLNHGHLYVDVSLPRLEIVDMDACFIGSSRLVADGISFFLLPLFEPCTLTAYTITARSHADKRRSSANDNTGDARRAHRRALTTD